MANVIKNKKVFTTSVGSVAAAMFAAGVVRKKTITQTLPATTTTNVVHNTGLYVQSVAIFDGTDYVQMDYSNVDANTIAIDNPGGAITNATIKIIY